MHNTQYVSWVINHVSKIPKCENVVVQFRQSTYLTLNILYILYSITLAYNLKVDTYTYNILTYLMFLFSGFNHQKVLDNDNLMSFPVRVSCNLSINQVNDRLCEF